MSTVGLLLAFGLSTGLMAQSCDIGDFTIDDISERVVVTNASTTEEAPVLMTFDGGRFEVNLPPGGSRTFRTLGTVRYSMTVYATGTLPEQSYRQSLQDLRSQLQDLSLTPEAPPAAISDALTNLYLVQTALAELHGDNYSQTCSNKIGTGTESHATATWTEAGGSGVWVLSCG